MDSQKVESSLFLLERQLVRLFFVIDQSYPVLTSLSCCLFAIFLVFNRFRCRRRHIIELIYTIVDDTSLLSFTLLITLLIALFLEL
jgi:hypothetical protein